eukprot:TRINITY_DN28721_c0_g1_i1.p1 TRINITY_DN28721_c0_g1~~TRINITY_DN28721_c0_g1_i1.p1  ORF type:complete len:164 (-),score=51.09 TRINITY_DN28721_c0_g1_i1:468-959(-)
MVSIEEVEPTQPMEEKAEAEVLAKDEVPVEAEVAAEAEVVAEAEVPAEAKVQDGEVPAEAKVEGEATKEDETHPGKIKDVSCASTKEAVSNAVHKKAPPVFRPRIAIVGIALSVLGGVITPILSQGDLSITSVQRFVADLSEPHVVPPPVATKHEVVIQFCQS